MFKDFIIFIYVCLVIFAILGGAGWAFYVGAPQFGASLLILGTLIVLDFFGKIKLPKFKDIDNP